MAKRLDPTEQFGAPGVMEGVREAPKKPVDPYSVGPSSYIPMSRYAESNKAASEAAAQRASQQVSGEAQQAQQALQKEYGQFMQGVQQGAKGTEYTGPAAYAPSDAVRQQYLKAQHDIAALGSTAGLQQVMGPGATMFGASLAGQAGAPGLRLTQQRYAGLGGDIGATEREAQEAVKGAQFATEVEKNKQMREQANRSLYQNYLDRLNAQNAAVNRRMETRGGGRMPMSYVDFLRQNNLPVFDESETGIAPEWNLGGADRGGL